MTIGGCGPNRLHVHGSSRRTTAASSSIDPGQLKAIPRGETDQEMWDSPLNTYLRDNEMGRAGTICKLRDMIRHWHGAGAATRPAA
jgi:hypothetical protein